MKVHITITSLEGDTAKLIRDRWLKEAHVVEILAKSENSVVRQFYLLGCNYESLWFGQNYHTCIVDNAI